jgi:hypothetical protein
MRIVLELDEDRRNEFVRELGAVNDRLLEVAVDGDAQETMQVMAYGIAGLCRLAAEILRPEPSEAPPGEDGQLLLFEEPDQG